MEREAEERKEARNSQEIGLFFIPNAVMSGSWEPAMWAQRFAQYLGSYRMPCVFVAARRAPQH